MPDRRFTDALMKPDNCRFCGYGACHVENDHTWYAPAANFYVVCSGCLAKGPSEISYSVAINSWNTAKRPQRSQS